MNTQDKRPPGGKQENSPETLAAQALGHVDQVTRALVAPIHLSTTYERDPDGGYRSGRGYTRPHNPTYDEPEQLLTSLENGSECLLFASGMAAATAVFQSLLPGDHVVAPRVMYWALRKWLVESALAWGLEVEFVDTGDLDQLAAAMRSGQTRLVWLETPANPTWEVTDIEAAAGIAHAVHARLVVDSTVASPVLTRPLDLGADLVVHSASKYLNGHSDVLAGAVVCRERDGFWQRIKAWRRDAGAMLGPFEAWLLLRGMRTLFVRVRQCSQTALAIARHFEDHPRIARVLYPGLAAHARHDVAARQMAGGFGGMLSVRHKGGEAAAIATAAAAALFKRATSLGGVESLIEHRASIEGPATPVPRDLLRLSIGLENPADLIRDLEQALDQSRSATVVSTPPAAHSGAAESAGDTASLIRATLDERIRPLLLERGGDLLFRGFQDGVVELDLAGSPGASLPLRAYIEGMLRHYVREDIDLRLVSVNVGAISESHGHALSLEAQVESILAGQINPAVAAHGGAVRLTGVEDGTVYLCFEGRCQGCAMAEVTLRQGVEPMLKEQAVGVVNVVDSTDHTSGTDPYFKTKKG